MMAKLDRLLVRLARGSSSGGFALLIVLVVLLALSLIFGAVLQSARQSTDEARARVVRLQLAAALDGALASTAYQLSREFQSVQFGRPNAMRIGDVTVTVVVRPEMSKLDVNYGTSESIRKLLVAAGISPERSTPIADAINAWRSGVGAHSAQAYTQADVAPSHPFETLADLALVRNIGPDLPTCLNPDITVYTRSGGIDASAASPRLRQAIYGNQPILPSSYYSVVGGDAARPDLYEISETAKSLDGSLVSRRQVVVRIAGDGARPFLIVSDDSPGPDSDAVSRACRRLAEHGQ
jgi:type II secretory pathway component PulK